MDAAIRDLGERGKRGFAWRAEPRKGPGYDGHNPAPYGARLANGSDQLAHRVDARLDQVLRPAVRVEDAHFIGVEPDVVVQRREDLGEFDRPPRRVAALAIGGADALPGPHPAAGEQRPAHQ